MKKIFWSLLITGGMWGLWHLAKRNIAELLRLRIAGKVVQEGQRTGKPVDKTHVLLSLKRFNKHQLILFDKYLDHWITRDWKALDRMIPVWKAEMLPIIRQSPEWKQYEGIIFGT